MRMLQSRSKCCDVAYISRTLQVFYHDVAFSLRDFECFMLYKQMLQWGFFFAHHQWVANKFLQHVIMLQTLIFDVANVEFCECYFFLCCDGLPEACMLQ